MKLRYKKRRNQHGAFLGAITPWDQSVVAELQQRGATGKLGFCEHLTPGETDQDQTVPAVWFPSQPGSLHCADCGEAIATVLGSRDVLRCDICRRDIRKGKTITAYWLRFGPVTTIRYWVCHDCA